MIRAQTVRVPNRRKPLSTTQKILRACAILWLLLVSPFAAYWAVQNYLHEADRLRPAPAAAAPVVSPTPTAAVPTPTAAYYLPDLSQPDRWPDQQLAFVREGNIWLAKIILDKDLRDEWLQKISAIPGKSPGAGRLSPTSGRPGATTSPPSTAPPSIM